MGDLVLVGDIGGTHVRLAVAHRERSGPPRLSDVAILEGDAYDSFDAALASYVDGLGTARPDAALIALAGPVQAGQVRLTNRDWTVACRSLERALAFRHVRLVNDYAAMARAVPDLPSAAFRVLQSGQPPVGERWPILVSGPGTGLGMATLVPVGATGWHVLTGEGGHAAFAPFDARERALASVLQRTLGYVSRERVLAGAGFEALHRALCEVEGRPWHPMSPADVLRLARDGDPLCCALCEIRARGTLYALGDAALMNGTRGGVVVTGGVAEHLADWLSTPEALARFNERGAMRAFMEALPVRLLVAGEAALLGAAALYFEQAEQP